MADPKTARFQFGLSGLFTKENPSLLGDGQYRSMKNMEVVQEGSISTIAGRKALGSVGGGKLSCYMIRKMTIDPDSESPSTPSTNPRYLGIVGATNDLYRTTDFNSFTKVKTGINSTNGRFTKRFSLASYSVGNIGSAWAFIASENFMLKDRGSSLYADPLPRWGILPAFGVATATPGGAGLLDGGDAASPAGSTPYDYRYCNIGVDTNNKGNPSQTMLADSVVANGTPAAVHLKSITVAGLGTDDPQVAKIAVYRRGGILFDTWRLVGLVDNPGLGATWSFSDNISDVDLEPAPQIELDNDPPVTSTAPLPITGKLSGVVVGGRQIRTVTLTPNLSRITPGTVLHLFYDNPEDVIIESVNVGASTITAYFQHTHTSGADWEVDVITGQACNLVISYGQFLVVAGDPNNPHILYRSKGDGPEEFTNAPADGSIATVACGTPSNPILGLCNFRGQIVTLNKNSIFETALFNGSFVTPSEGAKKGPVGMAAWCQTDSEIWFRTTDGIWSWDGGSLRKRSEAIDPIFHGEQVNGIPPASTDPMNIADTVLEYRRGHIEMLYWGIDGLRRRLICEPLFGDRWRKYEFTATSTGFMFTDPDTGAMVEDKDVPGVQFLINDQVVISGGVNYTSDGFTTDPATQGNPIAFEMFLPWMEFGSPQSQKLIEECYLDVDASHSTFLTATLKVDLLEDYSDTAIDTFTLNIPTSGRQLLSMLPDPEATSPASSFGRQARAFSFRVYGSAYPTQIQLFALLFRYQDTGFLTTGGGSDWMTLGHKFDKKLYQMTVEFDVAGVNQILVMDTLTGREGKTYTQSVQNFILSNPTILGSGRAMKTFPVNDGTIVKEVRIRPYDSQQSGVYFKILDVQFEKEDYPPDVTTFTPWDDGGYQYDKYLNQIDLSVNTNGVTITVKVQADGTDAGHTLFTFTVNTTDADRRRNITAPSGLKGKQWRLFVDPAQANIATGAGMFQLFTLSGIFKFQQADKGEVGHTFDWDELGHPWDKYLKTVTVEWDLSDAAGGSTVTMQLDTINGIGGQTVNSNVMQMVLSGGRGKRNFPIPVDTIAKLVRLYPVSTPAVQFKQWKYFFDKIDYPADIVLSTEWRDAQSPTDKNPSWVSVDADTAGVVATVNLYNESGGVLTFGHTGTVTNRKKNYAIPPDPFGKMWRMIISVGGGGKFQLFGWGFTRWTPWDLQAQDDPPEIILWTPWVDLSSPDDKNPSWVWIDANTGGVAIPVVLQDENGTVMTVTHSGTISNRRKNYPIPPDQQGKMWRLVPSLTAVKFQLFSWGFLKWSPKDVQAQDDPPDVILWTPWNDFGYPYGKAARNIILTVDTGGVTVPVHLQTQEAGTVQTFNINTTYTTRRVILACNSELVGVEWRLLIDSPLPNGSKFKLWDWNLEVVRLPAAVTHWDSYPQTFGWKFFKLIKQIWLMYQCASPVTFTIVSDTGTYSVVLPAHATRLEERFYLPIIWGAGLNKSKVYRITLDAATPFTFYAEGSGVEWLPIGMDRHAAYNQTVLSEFMTMGEAAA